MFDVAVIRTILSGPRLLTADHQDHLSYTQPAAAPYLAVSPRRQGEGLGRCMLQEAERWLEDHGAVKVNLMVRRDNAAVLGFYETLRYEDTDVMVLARWLKPRPDGADSAVFSRASTKATAEAGPARWFPFALPSADDLWR